MVVGALTRTALLHSMCDLKSVQMKVQHTLIRELTLYELELAHNAAEATKNICCVKGEGTVDNSTVTKSFKKFLHGYKYFDDQIRSGRPKTVDSDAVLQAIKVNPRSSPGRVSSELSISQFSVVHHLFDLSKSIRSYWILPHVTKISQNFWLTQLL